MQVFEFPGKLLGRNDYIDLCKKGNGKSRGIPRQNYKKDIQKEIAWAIKAARISPIKRPVFVSFIWYEEARRRDKDNVAFAKKFIFDAMKHNIFPDDNNRWIAGFADYFVYGQGQKVVVRIDEVDEVDIPQAVPVHDRGPQKPREAF